MVLRVESILLSSENAKDLANFYKDVVGLKLTSEAVIGGDEKTNLYGFEMEGGSELYIVDHSEIHGKNSNPDRIMLNFEVDNIEEVKRLKAKGVKEIGQPHHVENYGLIATFEDPDGNYFQLVQVKAA